MDIPVLNIMIPVLINIRIYLNDMHTKYEYRIHDKNLRSRIKK